MLHLPTSLQTSIRTKRNPFYPAIFTANSIMPKCLRSKKIQYWTKFLPSWSLYTNEERQSVNKWTNTCQMVLSAKDFLALKKDGTCVWGRLQFIHDNQESKIKKTFENYSNNSRVSSVAWRPMKPTSMINYHLPHSGEVWRHPIHSTLHRSASPLPNQSHVEQES